MRSNQSRFGSTRCGVSATSVILVLVLVAMLLGTGLWAAMKLGKSKSADAPLLAVVAEGPFDNIVLEEGAVESSNNVEIRCEVKSRNSGGVAIMSVVPEGSRVEQGDVLVRLDSSALEQELVQQQIIRNSSKALVVQAKNTYEAALIAKKEYLLGTFKQEEQTILSEVFVAEENLRRAQLSLESGERLAAKGLVTSLQLEGDRFAVEKARNELETAKTKLTVLRDYTKPKMLKQFESDIATAEAKWKSEENSHQLELDKLKEIEEQIELCVIRAPQPGQVVYANNYSSRGNAEFVVEEGASVRERQVIIRLPDPSSMQVKAGINESRITMVKTGMPVAIRLDAIGDKELRGEVTKVNEYPEPTSWFSSQIKKYGTIIRIIDPPPQIRPGLTAEVRIQVERLEKALQIPVQAAFQRGTQVYCVVYDGDEYQLREITIQSSNDKTVVVSSGLTAGEKVVLAVQGHLKQLGLDKAFDKSEVITSIRPPQPVKAAPSENENNGRDAGSGGSGGGPPSPAAIVNRVLENLDKDKDGKVSSDELQGASAGQRDRLAAADANGDGFLDRGELVKAFSAGRPPGD